MALLDSLTIELDASVTKFNNKIKQTQEDLKKLQKESQKTSSTIAGCFDNIKQVAQEAKPDYLFSDIGDSSKRAIDLLNNSVKRLNFWGKANKSAQDLKKTLGGLALGITQYTQSAQGLERIFGELARSHYQLKASQKGISSEFAKVRREQESAINVAKKWKEVQEAFTGLKQGIILAEQELKKFDKGSGAWKHQLTELQRLKKEYANYQQYFQSYASKYQTSITKGNRLLEKSAEQLQKMAYEEAKGLKALKEKNKLRKEEVRLQKQSLNLERSKLATQGKNLVRKKYKLLNAIDTYGLDKKRAGFDMIESVGALGMGFGTAEAGRSLLKHASEYQKITAQASTWSLNSLEKAQFTLLEDRLLANNKMLSRADAKDIVLAGQTSLGHFDYNILKQILPSLANYAQGSRALGYSNDSNSNIIKNYLGVAEARQQVRDPEAMQRTFELLWQVENVTGGKVTVKDFETILRNLGPGASLISDDGLRRLIAFAEQIKVAGHGGGGGAGAGISTVGNLVKMLQLMAAGKPTSQWAKQQIAKVPRKISEGQYGSWLDVDLANEANNSGNSLMSFALSAMPGIATMALNNFKKGNNKELMGAGFVNKNQFWSDPVLAMKYLGDAIIEWTQTNDDARKIFYSPDLLDKNGQFLRDKDGALMDRYGNRLTEKQWKDEKKKAGATYWAKSGMQHRTVGAATVFQDPDFQARVEHTRVSSIKQKGPYDLLQEQLKEGNWLLSVQQFEASWKRLGESLEPTFKWLGKTVQVIADLVNAIANFNRENKLLGSLTAIGIGFVGMAPAIAMATTSFLHLTDAIKRYYVASGKIASAKNTLASYPDKAVSIVDEMKKRNAIPSQQLLDLSQDNKLRNINKPQGLWSDGFVTVVDNTVRKVKKKFEGLFGKIKLGFLGLTRFLSRAIPVVGTIILGLDIGSVIWDWIKDIRIWGVSLQELFQNLKDGILEILGMKVGEKWKDPVVENHENAKNQLTEKQRDLSILKRIQTSGLAERFQNGNLDDTDHALLEELATVGSFKGLELTTANLASVIAKLNASIPSLEKAIEKTAPEVEGRKEREKSFNERLKESRERGNLEARNFASIRVPKGAGSTETVDIKHASGRAEVEVGDKRTKALDELASLVHEVTKDTALKDAEIIKQFNNPEFDFDAIEKFKQSKFEEVKKIYETLGQKDVQEYPEQIRLVIEEWIKKVKDALAKGLPVPSLAETATKQLFLGEKNADTGQYAVKGSTQAKILKAQNDAKNNSIASFVPQPVKYYNDLKAKIDEANADIGTMFAGQGKQGREYAEAQVLQRWLNGKFSLSSKNPNESPWMRKGSKGLDPANLLKDKKDKRTKNMSFNDFVDMQWQANQKEALKKATSDLASKISQSAEEFETTSALIEQGGISKLPSSITTLDKLIGKASAGIDKASAEAKEFQKMATKARASTLMTEVAKQTNAYQVENKNLQAEVDSYGLSTSQANAMVFERSIAEEKERNENLIRNLIKTREENAKNTKFDEKNTRADYEAETNKQVENLRSEHYKNLELKRKQFLQNNQTAGMSLVQEWTDLTKQLDTLQSEMMNGFIDMTEQMLDGNLDSWRDYAYNLLKLIRRQILQATFSPLLSVMTGLMNKGIATLFGDTKEANRQDAGIQQAGQTAYGMLGNGFYQWIFGKYLRGKNPYENGKNNPADKSIVDENGIETNYTGSIDDGTSSLQVTASPEQTQESWWNSFTTTFSEGFGSLWDSTKQVFSWMGDGISSLADGFMSLCGQPIEWLKNAFTSCANVIVEFMTSLATSNSAKAISGVITSVFGAVAGGVAGGGNGGEFGLSGDGYDYSQMGNRNFFAEVGKNQFHFSANANGGIVTSRGEIDLRKYARGGIARTPQLALFGEGSMPEAYVPLPDGRSIPVSFRNNGAVGETVGGNQISIVINVSNTNSGSSETSSADATEASKDASDMLKLGNRIKAIVRQEIITQSRPGGLLAQA